MVKKSYILIKGIGQLFCEKKNGMLNCNGLIEV